jgi:hypothetical protein
MARPIAGGFLGQAGGWRWNQGLMALFTGTVCILSALAIPETYSPVILRRRAGKLSEITGKVYKSKMDIDNGSKSIVTEYKIALSRPWILLIKEPIVLFLSIYVSIIYGILFLLFAAFPIIFQEGRGWNVGVAALPFLGVAIGMMAAVAVSIFQAFRSLPWLLSMLSKIPSINLQNLYTNIPSMHFGTTSDIAASKPSTTAMHLPKHVFHLALSEVLQFRWDFSGFLGPMHRLCPGLYRLCRRPCLGLEQFWCFWV